jgi:cell division septal protein FtsQ
VTARGRRLAVGLGLGLAAWVGGPRLLRHVGFFRVRQVELVGVRYLAPDAVIGALHLRPGASVFDDLDPPTARLERLPGIAAARIVRRFPGAVKVIVREEEAIALVPGEKGGPLTVVDGAGRPMPYDPSHSAPDLPVAASADSDLVSVLALVQSVDPALFEAISAARVDRNTVTLQVKGRRVLVRRDVDPDVIRAVQSVARDLTKHGWSYAELDARYAGQVVVRRGSRAGT